MKKRREENLKNYQVHSSVKIQKLDETEDERWDRRFLEMLTEENKVQLLKNQSEYGKISTMELYRRCKFKFCAGTLQKYVNKGIIKRYFKNLSSQPEQPDHSTSTSSE